MELRESRKSKGSKAIVSLLSLLTVVLLTLSACHDTADDAPKSGRHRLTLPVGFAIAAETTEETRAMGDPGTYESFRIPDYAYVYLVVDLEGGGTAVCIPTDLHNNELTNPITLSTDPEAWLKEVNTYDNPQSRNDSIYRYLSYLHFKVPNDALRGRLYMAMTEKTLPDLTAITLGDGTGHSTEADVLSMTFNVDNTLRGYLQDIYATPYNYRPNGTYYGTISDVSATSAGRLSIMLYHVAAKVDLMWNVAPERQHDLRLSYIQARQLKQQNCLLFKPTENTLIATDYSANYSVDLMDGDIGQQWYGRQYFYTIPYNDGGRFRINLHLLKNGDDKVANQNSGYNLTLSKALTSVSAVFSPWVRGDLKFTSNMDYKNETKTIE